MKKLHVKSLQYHLEAQWRCPQNVPKCPQITKKKSSEVTIEMSMENLVIIIKEYELTNANQTLIRCQELV